MLSWRAIGDELRPMTGLAIPVAIAELGWMFMTVVDTMMAGRLGAEAIGSVSFGALFVNVLSFFGLGILLGLDTLISQAFGARQIGRCNQCLVQGVWIATLLSPLLMVLAYASIPFARNWGVEEKVLSGAIPYMQALSWSILPTLLYVAFRRYLQSMNHVGPVMFALVSANLVNVAVNWLLIFGNLGFPTLGVEGAGWATTISRLYMAGVLLAFIVYKEYAAPTGLKQVSLRIDWPTIRTLLTLGFPVAMQICAEYGVFAVATALIARLDALSLAAHQIALNVASVTFMVPLGISSAGAVRVGHAVGRRDIHGAITAGWTALLLGASFMAMAGVALYLFPEAVLQLFTTDRSVFALGTQLLFLAAVFQLFDGIQVTAGGVLRGVGDTRTPMFGNLAGHWLLGLPTGYVLCFVFGLQATGIWTGLSLGLVFVALILLTAWKRTTRKMDAVVRTVARSLSTDTPPAH
jgi:MATE family multidrug resistance protein